MEDISSPKTSIVKQAPSNVRRFIIFTALSKSGPATYLLETHPTNHFGIRIVVATIRRENSPTMMSPYPVA